MSEWKILHEDFIPASYFLSRRTFVDLDRLHYEMAGKRCPIHRRVRMFWFEHIGWRLRKTIAR